jgi:uncharacterized protein
MWKKTSTKHLINMNLLRFVKVLGLPVIATMITLVGSAGTKEQELLGAVINDDTKTVAGLLKDGAALNFEDRETGATPLIYAVGQRNTDLVRTLIHYGAKADFRTTGGETALHAAAYSALKPVWEILINSKPDLNITNASGATPLMVASVIGNVEAVKLLIKAKAKITVEMPDGDTALLLASKGGGELVREKERRDVVLRLIKAGADPNHRNREKHSPLYYAVANEDDKMVKTLIENGAKINNEGEEDRETWEIAKSSENKRIIECLKAASENR